MPPANGLKINNESTRNENVNTLSPNRHFICFPCAPHDVPTSGKYFSYISVCYFYFASEQDEARRRKIFFLYLTGKRFSIGVVY